MSKSRALRSSWELRYLLADFDPFFLRTPWKEPSGSNSHHFHNLQNNWRNQLNVILPVVGREKEEEERRKEQNLKEKKAVECYLQTASEQADGWSWTCAYAQCTLSLSYLRRCNWLPLLLPLLRILTTSNETKRGKQKTRIRENSASSRNPAYPQTLTLQTLILQTPEKYRVAHPSHPIIPQMEDLDHRMVHHLSHAWALILQTLILSSLFLLFFRVQLLLSSFLTVSLGSVVGRLRVQFAPESFLEDSHLFLIKNVSGDFRFFTCLVSDFSLSWSFPHPPVWATATWIHESHCAFVWYNLPLDDDSQIKLYTARCLPYLELHILENWGERLFETFKTWLRCSVRLLN